eukprot:gene33571-43385_t
MSRVADFLGTVHHSYTYTIQEGLDAIREVIYHLETFDTTTVRASTPMFLMAPNPEELQAELRDKIANLYLFDCLRANKRISIGRSLRITIRRMPRSRPFQGGLRSPAPPPERLNGMRASRIGLTARAAQWLEFTTRFL